MIKNISLSVFILTMLGLTGCASKGIEVKAYVDEKARVDQEVSGNAGYLMGTTTPTPTSKTTRKVYVVEVSKAADTVTKKTVTENVVPTHPIDVNAHARNEEKVVPEVIAPTVVKLSEPVEYTVEKDDTLQKIAKKFYGSFNKWPKIYEANKEKIPNPDKITPGITITIPVLD